MSLTYGLSKIRPDFFIFKEGQENTGTVRQKATELCACKSDRLSCLYGQLKQSCQEGKLSNPAHLGRVGIDLIARSCNVFQSFHRTLS